ncbi:MAG: hypothetical protein OEY23_19840 [Acidimicrobiia bacterium]|nr:hypothetical protein [Acidimicrobiia bacterium]
MSDAAAVPSGSRVGKSLSGPAPQRTADIELAVVDRKAGTSLLGPWEKVLVAKGVRFVPSWIQTYHLTLATIGWAAGMVLAGWAGRSGSRWWLFVMSAMVIGQYVTDLFDGKIGRDRGTGLVKWGFFMDHFLDLVFAGCTVIAYGLLASPGTELWFGFLLLCSAAMMAVSFLAFAATNEFHIAFFGIGPDRGAAVLRGAQHVAVRHRHGHLLVGGAAGARRQRGVPGRRGPPHAPAPLGDRHGSQGGWFARFVSRASTCARCVVTAGRMTPLRRLAPCAYPRAMFDVVRMLSWITAFLVGSLVFQLTVAISSTGWMVLVALVAASLAFAASGTAMVDGPRALLSFVQVKRRRWTGRAG